MSDITFSKMIFLRLLSGRRYVVLSLFLTCIPLVRRKRPEAFNTYLSSTQRLLGDNGILYGLWKYAATGHAVPNAPFQPEYYLATNADVADSGVDPLLHFLTRGIHENRSPHPFIDPPFLMANMLSREFSHSLHRYCYDRNTWSLSPSPIVDVLAFQDNCEFELDINPVLRLFQDLPRTIPWIRRRSIEISITSQDISSSHTAAVRKVLTNSLGLGDGTPVVNVKASRVELGDFWDHGEVDICPGAFIALGEKYSMLNGSSPSSISNKWATSSEGLVYTYAGSSAVADVMVVAIKPITIQLLDRFEQSYGTVLIAPHNASQERALARHIEKNKMKHISVLNPKDVYRVSTDKIEVVDSLAYPSNKIKLVDPFSDLTEVAGMQSIYLTDVSMWHLNSKRATELQGLGIEIRIVDFSSPELWVSSVNDYEVIVTDPENFQTCLLEVPGLSHMGRA